MKAFEKNYFFFTIFRYWFSITSSKSKELNLPETEEAPCSDWDMPFLR